MKVLTVGSLNVDHGYRVARLAQPGETVAGTAAPLDLLEALAVRLPHPDLCLTLGAAGALYRKADGQLWHSPAPRVQAVDTTAAGDTFIGYLLADLLQGRSEAEALHTACRAAALTVIRPGAQDAIPRRAEVGAFVTARN